MVSISIYMIQREQSSPLTLCVLTCYKSDHESSHGPSRHGDDQSFEAEQDHAGLNGRVLRLHQTVGRGPVASIVLPLLRSLGLAGGQLDLVDHGPHPLRLVTSSLGNWRQFLTSGTFWMTSCGDTLKEGSLASLGPTLGPGALVLPHVPGTVGVLQGHALHTRPRLVAPVEGHRPHLVR